ncbi:MAG: hypothetical protein J6U54_10285 [Clostridiales bacterium]|nr:hypothetical protein [Clostridiales bacterium]
MTKEEIKKKRIEIFGKDYEEKVDLRFHDVADDQNLADIQAYARKGYMLITVEDVINYIKDRKRKVFNEFMRCLSITQDSHKHGRLWTPDNPLAMLMKRDDISVYERAAMYGVLVSALMLDYEEDEK